MEQYGATSEEELERIMKEENKKNIAKLQEKIAGIF